MQKDVIYIDVDDDVTAIIGKIKKSKEKIVALVPPKRIGVLQSAVNLRLLDRMARTAKKQLVLITHNQALMALAANASIPVAKNLQSKPEVAEVPALVVDDGDDIIDGSELPVGDHAKTAKNQPKQKTSRSDIIDDIDVETEDSATPISAPVTAAKNTKNKPKVKVPNFNKFRKRLFLGVGAGVLLTALLVWMFVFAPAATVVVKTRTTPAPVSATVVLAGTEATNYEKGLIKSVSQELKKEQSIEFEVTGEQDIGKKASGTMTVTRNGVSDSDATIPKGTAFTSGNYTFYSTQAATVPASYIEGTTLHNGSADVPVQAESPGADYNLSARSYTSGISGYSASGSEMTGGTTNIVKVPTETDVELAKGKLAGESDDEAKAELIAKFTNEEKVIDSSFTASRGTPTSSPAVGEEAKGGKATLTSVVTYTIYAIPQGELDSYLRSSLEDQIGQDVTQKVYDTGAEVAELGNFTKKGDTMTTTIVTSGQIGPSLDETALKEQVKGKIYGQIQSELEALEGIETVDVHFSYFWVRTVPNDTNKITIEIQSSNE